MGLLGLSALLGLVVLVAGQGYEIPDPEFSLMEPQGLRMIIPHEEGMTLWGVHYSVNVPLPGVDAGEWNFDITSPTGEQWLHENPEVEVVPGDTVYYWHLVIHNGQGYQKLEQSWTATAPEPSTTTEATTTSTQATTTAGDLSSTTTTSRPPTDSPRKDQGSSLKANKYRGYTKNPKARIFGKRAEDCDNYPCLIFEDEFNDFDLDVWEHEITAGGGGNWEFQYYTNNRSNSYVKDGLLYIKPTLTADKFDEGFLSSGTLELWGAHPPNLCTGNQWWGCMRQGTAENYVNPAQSARLRSVNSFSVRYGRVEVEAQMPRGDWIWPAIWMLPRHEMYGTWPASGEIDLVESRGNLDLRNENGDLMGHQHAGSTLHWGPFMPYNGYERTAGIARGDFGDGFHLYSMEWDDNHLKLMVDDETLVDVDPGPGGFFEYGEFDQFLPPESNPWQYGDKMAPFDREFYFIMNVAVGGTNGFFPDSWTNANGAKPWSNTSPFAPREFWEAVDTWHPTWNPNQNNGEDAAMKINYVRVWKLAPDL